ncbi:MAG: hypothetical protein WA718_21070, partial [Terriglobales bacterium]
IFEFKGLIAKVFERTSDLAAIPLPVVKDCQSPLRSKSTSNQDQSQRQRTGVSALHSVCPY